MPRIDFYLLAGVDPRDRRVYACRLAEKAWRQGYRVYVRAAAEAETSLLDDLLWTFRQGSFVPHETHPGASPETPILIGHGPAPENFGEVLVNLAADVPSDYGRFERVAEIIDQNADIKRDGRTRFRFYQDHGHEVQTHDLNELKSISKI